MFINNLQTSVAYRDYKDFFFHYASCPLQSVGLLLHVVVNGFKLMEDLTAEESSAL